MEADPGKGEIPPEALPALSLLQRRLGDSIVAVYLHGSAVAGGLRKHSDVDLLVIVDTALTASVRAQLAVDLMTISGRYPNDRKGRRPLEVLIVRSSDLSHLPYPARAEFVYGEWLREVLERNVVPEPQISPEFTLLLAQVREEAVSLTGPTITDLIPEIPISAVRRATRDLLPDLLESFEGDERNVLLTLARMWRTVTTGHFVSKNAAADWALSQLSGQAESTLTIARDSYLGSGDDDLHLRRTDVWYTAKELKKRILFALQDMK